MSERARLEPFAVDSVGEEAMRTMAALLRDPTPIHIDPEALAALGLGERLINQGPANLGYVINAILATGNPRLEKLEIRFLGNVLAGDRAVAGGEQSAEDPAEWDVWLDVEDGARALAGKARISPRSP